MTEMRVRMRVLCTHGVFSQHIQHLFCKSRQPDSRI
jgi:hypothetical protein